jgi:twitching motility protein PilT
MRLEVGRRIYVVQDGEPQDVGREALKPATLHVLVTEVVPSDELQRLGREPRVVNRAHGSDSFRIEVSRAGGELRMVIRPAAAHVPRAPAGAYITTEHTAIRGERRATDDPESARPGPDARARLERPAAASAPAAKARAPVEPVATAPRAQPRGIEELLRLMVAERASDLHLSATLAPTLRVHGEIRFLAERPALSSSEIEDLLRPITPAPAWEQFTAQHDADFAHELPGLARFRVNLFVDRKGTGAVFRQIPIEVLSAEALGVPKSLVDLCYLSKGLVLVTGPTGSGKSTTLAALIDHINHHRSDHIITIEDPIEFVHTSARCLVNQREVGGHTGSFKAALRAALREDPDVVLVGEMRDLETVSIALETAETGHLVFGTLHTTTAISTVDRVIDQFPPDQQAQVRVMLADALKGVIAQVLCRRIGGGRVAAMEILLVNQAVSSLIREGKCFQIPSIMQTSRGLGMVTMNDSLLALAKEKQVEPREAWLRATDKAGLLTAFKAAGLPTSFA